MAKYSTTAILRHELSKPSQSAGDGCSQWHQSGWLGAARKAVAPKKENGLLRERLVDKAAGRIGADAAVLIGRWG